MRVGNRKITRTPQQVERQERCFDLSVMYGKTIRQIAAEVGTDTKTVMADIRAEESRRAEENQERRDAELARSIAFYEGIARKAQTIAENARMPGDTARIGDALKARERMDKIRGLDAPLKIDAGLDRLLAAMNARDDDDEEPGAGACSTTPSGG